MLKENLATQDEATKGGEGDVVRSGTVTGGRANAQ